MSSFTWTRKPTLRCRSREPVLCCKFSVDDRLIVAGHFDGTIVGYDVASSVNKFEVNVTPKESRARLPVTAIAFRPAGARPLLLVGCSNGQLERWELRTLERTSMLREENNEVYAVDYRSDGHLFATAGRDAAVRVYDDATGELVRKFSLAPDHPTNTPALRLYSVHFHPEDPNLIFAGGWGNAVRVYDLRDEEMVSKSVELFGPYIVGDCLDIKGNTLLTASHRPEDRLQLWDLEKRTAAPMAWPTKTEFLPTCARFSSDPTGDYIACGGGGGNGMKEAAFVLERRTNKLVVDATFDAAINTCHFAAREPLVAFGDNEGQLHIFENKFGKR